MHTHFPYYYLLCVLHFEYAFIFFGFKKMTQFQDTSYKNKQYMNVP